MADMAEPGTKELEVPAEAPAPSLLSLCLDAVAASLIRDSAGVGAARTGWPGDCSGGGPGGFAEEVGEETDDHHLEAEHAAEALPWELLHRLASRLPPAALELLHHAAHARYPAPLPFSLHLQYHLVFPVPDSFLFPLFTHLRCHLVFSLTKMVHFYEGRDNHCACCCQCQMLLFC